MNFMHIDAFERLEKRYVQFMRFLEDPTQCDPEIVTAVVNINRHPGIVTIWSCQGHIGKNQRGRGSLMVGVRNQSGLEALFRFQHRLMELRGKAYETSLTTEYKRDITLNEKGPNAAVWPVWILSWAFECREVPAIYSHVNNASLAVMEYTP